jgi:large subunit ribosomal protein L10
LAISKARKEELVAQYKDLLDNSRAVFVADYNGLTVKQLEALREEVRKADGAFHVTKNTLLALALTELGKPAPDELLSGQVATGFALGEVPALAKTLVDFAKDQDRLVLRGGIMDTTILDAEQVVALAKLPSLDQLRSQLIGLIGTPAQNIAQVVAGGVRQIVNVLDAYVKKDDSAETEIEAEPA